MTTFRCRECYVYRVPPAGTLGHRADSWGLDKWQEIVSLRVVEHGDSCDVRLEDLKSSELYAQCPLPPDAPVLTVCEPVVDSSRYFVIRIVDTSTLKERHAYVGIGFPERGQAIDFMAATQQFARTMERQRASERVRSRPFVVPSPLSSPDADRHLAAPLPRSDGGVSGRGGLLRVIGRARVLGPGLPRLRNRNRGGRAAEAPGGREPRPPLRGQEPELQLGRQGSRWWRGSGGFGLGRAAPPHRPAATDGRCWRHRSASSPAPVSKVEWPGTQQSARGRSRSGRCARSASWEKLERPRIRKRSRGIDIPARSRTWSRTKSRTYNYHHRCGGRRVRGFCCVIDRALRMRQIECICMYIFHKGASLRSLAS